LVANISVGNIWIEIVVAFVGALILLVAFRALTHRGFLTAWKLK
jgi:uncharacterized membrane protein YeaQ/YmgE (transglycosylase-associated protein family)